MRTVESVGTDALRPHVRLRDVDEVSISGNGRYVVLSAVGPDPQTCSDDVGFEAYPCPNVYRYDRVEDRLELVSTSLAGGIGDRGAWSPSISDNGRLVAFVSDSANLVRGDTNSCDQFHRVGPCPDVFVRDMLAGGTVRVSVSSEGREANSYSMEPSMAGSGRYIAFTSYASNLIDDDTHAESECWGEGDEDHSHKPPGCPDIFVHDQTTHATLRASVSTTGDQIGGASNNPAISDDGRYLVFSTKYYRNYQSGSREIFRRDLHIGETVRIPHERAQRGGLDGADPATSASSPLVSNDGRFVAVVAYWPEDTPLGRAEEIHRYDDRSGRFELVVAREPGDEGHGHMWLADMSADGRLIGFTTDASLAPDDANRCAPGGEGDPREPCLDVYVADVDANTITRASVTSAGDEKDARSRGGSLPDDGGLVIFQSEGVLAPKETGGIGGIFLRDLRSGTTTQL